MNCEREQERDQAGLQDKHSMDTSRAFNSKCLSSKKKLCQHSQVKYVGGILAFQVHEVILCFNLYFLL